MIRKLRLPLVLAVVAVTLSGCHSWGGYGYRRHQFRRHHYHQPCPPPPPVHDPCGPWGAAEPAPGRRGNSRAV